jgi:uncharacterized membrane protein YozB (DUF420 family)
MNLCTFVDNKKNRKKHKSEQLFERFFFFFFLLIYIISLYCRLNTNNLNDYLSKFQKHLTAKVFRFLFFSLNKK